IYRVVTEHLLRGEEGRDAISSTPLAEALVREYPEVEQAARIAPEMYEAGSNLVRTAGDEQNRYEDGFLYADPSFLDLFRFPMVEGDPSTVLDEPFTVALTARQAKEFSPEGNAVGQPLILNNATERPFVVTGVLADLPANTHLRFDYLL